MPRQSELPDDPIAAIRATVAAIPRGRVASYGEVAHRAGLPGRARLVGRVLGDTPAEAPLPWHRVLRSSGEFAFPRGSRAFREQQRRLAAEGVDTARGRVDLARYGWGRDLDAELWGAPPPAPVRRRAAKA
jgi:methylated-DNA-protein-cysteine methyltransferase-like protein